MGGPGTISVFPEHFQCSNRDGDGGGSGVRYIFRTHQGTLNDLKGNPLSVKFLIHTEIEKEKGFHACVHTKESSATNHHTELEILGLVETTYFGHILLGKYTLQRDSQSLQIFFMGGSKSRRISKYDGI